MKKEELFEILTKDKNIVEKLHRRAVYKRVFALLMLIFSLLVLTTLIQTMYWGIFLDSDKKNYWGMTFMGIWIITIFGLVMSDSYNPLSKVGKFNNQFFVLIEVLISEIEKSKRLSYNVNEQMLLFKRYLHKMNEHAKSLYIFENSEIASITSKLSSIPNNKLRNMSEYNKDIILKFLKSLNILYECKMNERPYNEQEYQFLINNIKVINNFEPARVSTNKRGFQILEILQKNKKTGLISTIVVFGLFGLTLKLMGANDSNYIDYFMYSITIVSAILTVLSLKDKE
ncbi:hypothetical protein MNQ98_29185 [Paenibacillus sp. N3/727]|uniref:hypothetical protein n=1 Tax=Paenibacillus sp. N3/727 TaxID=2925845 RepID=UPI001F532190|nr:hypothetical protein [Paenibacillus sp. N3/727]UNK18425.1 hypothetical protein MNQ98_29185 [Paenibacillus sp. N3/727]